MDFHPITDKYPAFSEQQFAELCADIQEHGLRVPIVTWQGQIIDGRHREQACRHVGREPVYSAWDGDESDLEAYVDSLNRHRRHLTPEELEERRVQRVTRTAEKRREGKSLRAIAEEEGVSHTQVKRDLEEASTVTHVTVDGESSTVPGGTVEPTNGKVTGRDGRTRTATPEKPAILCDRCQRVGAVPGCNQCKEASKAAKEAKQKAKAEARKAGSETTDAFGNVVPKGCLDAWGDGWIQETYDFLCSQSEAFRKRRLADGMKKREKHYPFFHAPDFIDGVGFVIEYFDKLIQHVKDKRPAGVCPACGGEKCAECKFSGLVPRAEYKAISKKEKV